jgi:hypothetical protein
VDNELTERLRELLGLNEDREEFVRRLDRLERRLERLNITPKELDMLEEARQRLEGADATIDAITPTPPTE